MLQKAIQNLLVDRVPGVEDRRTKYLRLSDYGEKMMTAWRLTRIDRALETLQHLDAVERRMVLSALGKLLEAANAFVPSAPSSEKECPCGEGLP